MTMLEVLWRDTCLVAVLKPAGIPTQPDRTQDTDLATMVREQLDVDFLGIVHRLDRPVSGVVLFGCSPESTASLSLQFKDRRVKKEYWAIVEGHYTGAAVLRNSLSHDVRRHMAMVAAPIAGAPSAELHVTVVVIGERYTLLSILPQGGAFHQIRAQLAATGHPIKGDVKYGARRGEKDRSIALHAKRLSVEHPITGTTLTIEAVTPNSGLWPGLLKVLTT